MACKLKLLSIDGGGIRGIIPALMLAEIEKRTGKRVFELFDLIAGSSTGGLLALGLTVPNRDRPTEALYTAQDLVNLYREQGRRIFTEDEHWLETVTEQAYNQMRLSVQTPPVALQLPEVDLNSFRGPKFISSAKEEVFTRFLGDTPIAKALKEVFITSYDTELRTPIFFTSNEKAENIGINFRKLCKDISMTQVAMATSAAPTYFAPYQVTTSTTDSGYYSLVDGGVFANNPTTLAMIEALISHKRNTNEAIGLNDILIASFGTGALRRIYRYQDIQRWGRLHWIGSMLNITLDGQSESVTCQLEQLLPEMNSVKQYYRFQGALDEANDDIDDTSPTNIALLEKLAQQIIQQQESDLNQLCEQLIA